MGEKKINVLIVEDNPADASLVAGMLEYCRDPSFQTSNAERLDTALEMLEDGKFDAVLLDLILPDSKGLGGLDRITAQKPYVPVVLLTGMEDENIGIQALQKNAGDYLVKGKIDEHLLSRSIQYAIERKKAEAEIRKVNARLQKQTAELQAANKALKESRMAALNLMDDALAARRQTERTLEELRQSQQDLYHAQQVGQIGSWRMDVKRNVLTWSDENHRIFGVPKGTPLTYETFLNCVAPEDRNYVNQKWKQALDGNDYDIEHRIVVNGQIKWVREKAYPEFDESGELWGGFGITQDITNRKLAEEQIRNLARFPAENPFPVLRLSKDGTILYSNTPGQVLLEEWNCQTSQKAPEYWCNLVRKSLRSARTQVEQTKCGDRIFSFMITPVPDGQYVNLYGRDITVQEQVKGVLRKSRDQLEVQVKERTAELVKTVAMLQGQIEQRKRTERLLRLEEARLEALVHVSNIHKGSVDEICHFILEQGIALTNSKVGFIGFLSKDESVYTLHAVSKAMAAQCDVAGNPTHWPVNSAGIWADAIRRRKTLFVNNYCKTQPGKKRLPSGHVPLDRFMIVPLLEGEKVVVVAGLGNKASNYDSSDERQMNLLLAGMWNYIQRKHSTEALQQRTAELSTLNIELEKEVAERRRAEQSLRERSRDLDAFFSHTITPLVILDRKFNFVRVNKAYAEACQRDISEFAGHNHFEFYPHEENERIFKRVVRTKKPYHVLARPFSFPDRPEWGVTYWDWTLVPVLDEAGKVQLLILSLKDVTEHERTERRKSVTNSLLALFAKKTSRKEYLDSVVEIIRYWSGCKCVGMRITNDEGHIPYESSVGFSEDFLSLENDLSLHKDACVCIRVITQTLERQEAGFMTAKGSFHCDNTFTFLDSLSEDEKKQNRGNCPKAGFASIAVVPIRYREEILGAIHLADENKNKISKESVEFLEDMALLIGEAVHRFDIEQKILADQTMLRALALELELAEESERRRIAVDLHDSIGQILAFSRRELAGLEKIDSGEFGMSLKEVGRQLDKAIKQTRSLSFELSPSVLYDLGLESALEDLAEIFSRERNIKCRFESGGEFEPIEDAIKVLLYRSVRELLINVAKHAGASEAKITLRRLNNEAYINVEDNGEGFDASILERRSEKSRGFGLFSIQERLGQIDGRFKIQTSKGRGTKITLVAPLSDNSNERKD
jgi:PAS domain S-box-containing protein